MTMLALKCPVTPQEYDGYLDAYQWQHGTRDGALTYVAYEEAITELFDIYETAWSTSEASRQRAWQLEQATCL